LINPDRQRTAALDQSGRRCQKIAQWIATAADHFPAVTPGCADPAKGLFSAGCQPAEPGHRWLTVQGAYADNPVVLDRWATKGAVFDSPHPALESGKAGTLIIEFSDCNTGTVSYDITSIDCHGVIPIARIALDNVPFCESLNEQLQQNQR